MMRGLFMQRDRRGPERGRKDGRMLLGTDENGDEIWMTGDELRQHVLVTGGEAEDRRYVLGTFVDGAMAAGATLLYVDESADGKGLSSVLSSASVFGRSHDVHVLDFSSDPGPSHTFNPLSRMSVDAMAWCLVDLMDDKDGDGAMWRGKATTRFVGLLAVLRELSERDGRRLDLGRVAECQNLDAMIEFAYGDTSMTLTNATLKRIRAYLTTLPGFDPEKGHAQSRVTRDRDAYLETLYDGYLSPLVGDYARIFLGDDQIDVPEIFLNGRILAIRIPGTSIPDETRRLLGRIVLAGMKGNMNRSVGAHVQGDWREVVDNRQSIPSVPRMAVFDGASTVTVNGMALMTAQWRAMGNGLVIDGEAIVDGRDPSLDAMREAGSIVGNTNTKIMIPPLPSNADDLAARGTVTRTVGYGDDPGATGKASTRRIERNAPAFAPPSVMLDGECLFVRDGTARRLRPISVTGDGRERPEPLVMLPELPEMTGATRSYFTRGARLDAFSDLVRSKGPGAAIDVAPIASRLAFDAACSSEPSSSIRRGFALVAGYASLADGDGRDEDMIWIGDER